MAETPAASISRTQRERQRRSGGNIVDPAGLESRAPGLGLDEDGLAGRTGNAHPDLVLPCDPEPAEGLLAPRADQQANSDHRRHQQKHGGNSQRPSGSQQGEDPVAEEKLRAALDGPEAVPGRLAETGGAEALP